MLKQKHLQFSIKRGSVLRLLQQKNEESRGKSFNKSCGITKIKEETEINFFIKASVIRRLKGNRSNVPNIHI
jgi:hypothetical protein